MKPFPRCSGRTRQGGETVEYLPVLLTRDTKEGEGAGERRREWERGGEQEIGGESRRGKERGGESRKEERAGESRKEEEKEKKE